MQSKSSLQRKSQQETSLSLASGKERPQPTSGLSDHSLANISISYHPPTADEKAERIHHLAQSGIHTPSSALPYEDRLQQAFGHYDLSTLQAHLGSEATASAQGMQALAYTSGEHLVFAGSPDLHTVAHEAAHAIQQRGHVQLANGVGKEGDSYEQHANAVASQVLAGRSAEALLTQGVGGKSDTAFRSSVTTQHPHPVSRKVQRLVNVDWDDLGGGTFGVKSVAIQRDSHSTGGAHTTANIVFEQQVKTAITNKSFDQAYTGLNALYSAASDEPLIKSTTGQPLNKAGLNAEEKLIDIFALDPTTLPPQRHQSIIQQAAGYYLTYRNAMEFAILPGVSGTKNIGEEAENVHNPAIQKASQDIQNSGGNTGILSYLNSLGKLFDYQAMQAEKLDKKAGALLFARHIRDIFRAYPIDEKYQDKVLANLDKLMLGWTIDAAKVKAAVKEVSVL